MTVEVGRGEPDGAPLLGQVSGVVPDRPLGATLFEARAETLPAARPMTQQIGTAITNAPNGQVEIRLDPEELGRVALQMQTDGDRVSLIITAERHETTELLRRHLHELAQEFRALGYRSVDIGFGGQGGAQGGAGGGEDRIPAVPTDASGRPVPEIDALAPALRPPLAGQPGSGLDLRL
ncbi:flagellar hook-length control protein FliK [uncultured Limimaricola sp.]|uniref:flagellar hook-length control protein FliK n=1 Tax=uncultured Limimaricola sp. TaxID=2211667 RepID=UPI0030F9CCA9